MARALARGWGATRALRGPGGRASGALAAETGGEALAGNAEVARGADLVVLAHKPAQLAEVAAELAPHASPSPRSSRHTAGP